MRQVYDGWLKSGFHSNVEIFKIKVQEPKRTLNKKQECQNA